MVYEEDDIVCIFFLMKVREEKDQQFCFISLLSNPACDLEIATSCIHGYNSNCKMASNPVVR